MVPARPFMKCIEIECELRNASNKVQIQALSGAVSTLASLNKCSYEQLVNSFASRCIGHAYCLGPPSVVNTFRLHFTKGPDEN